jgi:hypothetical protein
MNSILIKCREGNAAPLGFPPAYWFTIYRDGQMVRGRRNIATSAEASDLLDADLAEVNAAVQAEIKERSAA